MATISLKLQLDKAQAVKGFEEITKAPDRLAKAVKKSSNDSKKALEDLAKTTAKVPKIPPPVTQKETNLIKALKKEVRDLQSAAIAAGEGTAEYARLLDLAASKQAELRDLRDVVASLDPDVKAAAFTNLASTAVGAGQGIAGALALAGVEGEEYQKVLTRLQGIEAIGQGIKSLGQLKDEWGKVKIAINSYLLRMEAKIVAQQVNTVVTAETAVAEEAATVAAVQHTEAITAQTLAQRALALVQAATPWGAIAIGVGLVVTAIAAYVAHTEAAEEAERIRNTAIDGTVLANEELRNSYNELIIQQRKFALDLKVVRGELSALDAEISKNAIDQQEKARLATNEYNASLAEQDVWYKNITASIISLTTGMSKEQTQLALNAEARKKYNESLAQSIAEQIKADNAARNQEQLQLENENKERAKTSAENQIQILIERLETQKVLLKAAGKDTINIQRQIIEQETQLALSRVANQEDYFEQEIIINEQKNQKLLALDIELADQRLKIQEDLLSKLAALQKTIYAKDDVKGSPEVEARKELDATLLAIQMQAADVRKNQQNLSGKQLQEQEEALQALRVQAYKQYNNKLTQLRSQKIAADIAAEEATFATRLERLETEQQLEIDAVDLLSKQQGESEAEFIRSKEDMKTSIQLEYAKTRLEILKEQGEAENMVAISNQLVTIKKLQDQVEKLEKDEIKKTGRKWLKKLLGLDDEGLDSILSEFSNLLQQAESFTSQLLDERESALEQKAEQNSRELEENQKHLDELKSQLEKQLEEQAAGRANNVQGIKDAIAQEQAAREGQLQDQKKIQAEQERLARQRALVESGQQLSSIISAVANIIEGWSTVPLIGSALGIAAAALMLGSFVGLKAKAASATAPGFYTGTKKAPPGMKWVGERGPELINDGGGYAIMNNPDSMKLMDQYKIPAVYKPDMNYDVSQHIIQAAQEGRSAQNVVLNQRGTEKRLDELIELNKKPTVRSVVRKRKA